MSVGDLAEAVGWVAAVIGVLLGVIGLLGRPVEQHVAGPDGWVLVAPMVSLVGSLLLLGGVGVLLVADAERTFRVPDDDESTRSLARHGVLWVSVVLAGWEVAHIFGDGVLGAVGVIAGVIGLLPAFAWSLDVIGRAALLWSTRGYSGGDPEP